MANPETLLFNRYTREDCGMPPRDADVFGDRLPVAKTLALLLLLAGAAWMAGRAHAAFREDWLRGLPSRIAQAGSDAGLRFALMRRGAMFAAALPGTPRARRDLALAATAAAEYAPRRAGYVGSALALLDGAEPADDETPLERVVREMTLSGLHEEAGEYAQAFAALDRAEKALSSVDDAAVERSFRLLLVNAQAYCLATATESEGGNARRALELARLAVSSRDALPGGGFPSASAAFVDTLATARMKNSLPADAVEAQRLALGLAESRGLEVYLHHFDTFRAATASKGEPHVQ